MLYTFVCLSLCDCTCVCVFVRLYYCAFVLVLFVCVFYFLFCFVLIMRWRKIGTWCGLSSRVVGVAEKKQDIVLVFVYTHTLVCWCFVLLLVFDFVFCVVVLLCVCVFVRLYFCESVFLCAYVLYVLGVLMHDLWFHCFVMYFLHTLSDIIT